MCISLVLESVLAQCLIMIGTFMTDIWMTQNLNRGNVMFVAWGKHLQYMTEVISAVLTEFARLF